MATKEERERERLNQRVLNRPEMKNLRQRIEDNNKSTTSILYGADQSFIDRNNADFDKIRGTMKNVSEKYKSVTGNSPIEFLTRMVIEDERESNKKKGKNGQPEQGKGMMNINQVLENPNNGIVNELFMKDRTRFKAYDDYDALYEYIPQLAQAIEVYVDNIMSPDDFTKDVFSTYYNDRNVTELKGEKKVITNIKNLEDTYKIEDKSKDWIRKTLYMGDQFVAVLPLEKEFNKILGENGELLNEQAETVAISESNVALTKDEEILLEGMFNPEDGEEGDGRIDWKSDLAKLMNENVGYSENRYSVIKDELLTESEYAQAFGRGEWKPTRESDIGKKKDIKKSKKEIMTDGSMLLGDPGDDSGVKISGSYVKLLDPRRVVKINMGDTCFGYYYIETNDDRMMFSNNAFGNTKNFTLKSTQADLRTDSEYMADPKTRLIVDVFAKNISKKLNKKFIENNKEFKNLIYELVKQEYIIKKRINIVYLSPEEVEHFSIDENGEGYGKSKFSRILFSAKLYLAVLTTTLMMKISRSADHRTFYIETGLSKDVEGIIQSFVREIKSKEVKLSDLKSIDSIFNNIGQFHDYFIPQVNGEKAIDIDTTPGQSTEVENEFLEYLKKTMISGMGIPASFLQYSDEMEFARSVSMMNGMFLRTIVGLQKSLGENFSNVYRKLYRNEYGELEKLDDEEEFVVDYNSIEVRFPSPASLNMTNMADQISNTQTIIDTVVNTLMGSSGDDAKRDKVTREVTKKYLPNFEWDFFESLLNETTVEDVESKLTNGDSEEEV
jgi:hypothetical protein